MGTSVHRSKLKILMALETSITVTDSCKTADFAEKSVMRTSMEAGDMTLLCHSALTKIKGLESSEISYRSGRLRVYASHPLA